MSSTIIRPFEESDLNRVFSLYGRVFGEQPLERFRRRWRWQFFDNPPTDVLPSRMWVADHAGEIVGFVACFPVRQKVFDQEIVIRRTCDLMVSPATRIEDPTIGIRLLGTMKSGPGDTLWVGMGYSREHGTMRQLLGHRAIDAIPFYIRPYDVKSIARFLDGSGRLAGFWSRPPGSWLVNGVGTTLNVATAAVNATRRPRAPREYVVERIERAGAEIDQLWANASPSVPIIAVRDRRFVQWRFFDDPVFENTVLVARSSDGTPEGYLAMRLATKGAMRVGRIMDIFCPPASEAAVRALVHDALERFRREKVHAVSCLGLHPGIQKTVRRFLYLAPSNRQNPALLYWKGEPELREAVYDVRNWHLSHADGDEGFAP